MALLAAAATVLLAAANAAALVQMPPPFPQLQGRTLSAVLSGTAATSASAPGRRQQLYLVEGWRADAVAWAIEHVVVPANAGAAGVAHSHGDKSS